MDSKGAVCGMQVYGLSGIQGVCGCSSVSNITLFVFPTGNAALKVLISLLHCQAPKIKWRGILWNKATSNSLADGLAL